MQEKRERIEASPSGRAAKAGGCVCLPTDGSAGIAVTLNHRPKRCMDGSRLIFGRANIFRRNFLQERTLPYERG